MLTLPQIEIMQSDLPHTLYHKESRGKKDNKVYSQSDIDEATRLCEEALKKSRARRQKRQQEEGYSLEEIFNGEAER